MALLAEKLLRLISLVWTHTNILSLYSNCQNHGNTPFWPHPFPEFENTFWYGSKLVITGVKSCLAKSATVCQSITVWLPSTKLAYKTLVTCTYNTTLSHKHGSDFNNNHIFYLIILLCNIIILFIMFVTPHVMRRQVSC